LGIWYTGDSFYNEHDDARYIQILCVQTKIKMYVLK